MTFTYTNSQEATELELLEAQQDAPSASRGVYGGFHRSEEERRQDRKSISL